MFIKIIRLRHINSIDNKLLQICVQCYNIYECCNKKKNYQIHMVDCKLHLYMDKMWELNNILYTVKLNQPFKHKTLICYV